MKLLRVNCIYLAEVIYLAIKIYIDQGHNPQGINAGAEGFGLREQDINYGVGQELYKLLSADNRFEARLSRPTESTSLGTSNATSLSARVNAANAWPADYFISIHSNASTNPQANGSEVYVYRTGGKAADLAEDVLEGIVDAVGTKNNGVRVNSSLYVLRKTTMPAILVELGYITNREDATKLETMQPEFARGIYNGLLDYFEFDKN